MESYKKQPFKKQSYKKYISLRKLILVVSNKQSLRGNHLRSKFKKIIFFVHNIKMINLSLNKLKIMERSRAIKGYKSMSEERLLSSLNESESVKES